MTSESLQPPVGPARRTVVAAVGAAGLAAALTACGSDDMSSKGASDSGGGKGGSDGGSVSVGAAGTVVAKTSDIPEGGGMIFKEPAMVVTQPTKGEFKAFSSKCTHQGCPVTGISKGVITCPCHHSAFSIADGSVKHLPATQPLASVRIDVAGDEIKLA
ncbi:Rieske (2Fe-2S) protein [Streptomyces tropicalis]|uniref:Cytochrome bc1 complex Rieske iron-sulfur subunit n=1 Tax=Streptomyces tropicalis TaxID=3034234 RepID=A0ABT6A4R3_9ACTN|nr:Rieske (2Fe-2S) protein [Streptomyces tropicalis]MDF3299640.1 Rieske (2Fe-2S) protein [Streptomyces tropicalis]